MTNAYQTVLHDSCVRASDTGILCEHSRSSTPDTALNYLLDNVLDTALNTGQDGGFHIKLLCCILSLSIQQAAKIFEFWDSA